MCNNYSFNFFLQCPLEGLSLEAHELLDSPIKKIPEEICRKKSLRSYSNKFHPTCLTDSNNNLPTSCFLPISNGRSPLPELVWADPDNVWEVMHLNEKNYKRDPFYLKKHPSLQVRMRTVLLDWLIEVSI